MSSMTFGQMIKSKTDVFLFLGMFLQLNEHLCERDRFSAMICRPTRRRWTGAPDANVLLAPGRFQCCRAIVRPADLFKSKVASLLPRVCFVSPRC